jgi:transcriptional regulator with XRE-family HTH domain
MGTGATKTNQIAVAIASRMAERGLSDRATADLLEVSQPTISRWRTSRNVPNAREAIKLAAFLGVKVSVVDGWIRDATIIPPPVIAVDGHETVGVLLRNIEMERGLSAPDMIELLGIDKSRYYRLRSDRNTPHFADIPELATRLGVNDERLALAAYRTELSRQYHRTPSPPPPRYEAAGR